MLFCYVYNYEYIMDTLIFICKKNILEIFMPFYLQNLNLNIVMLISMLYILL
jgi:hypothetical protein